ncbi:MAG: hypothetical protein IKR90_00710, partial [Clostridia bacterium]|nr:hypothetical protein [Clostridia bacterium]
YGEYSITALFDELDSNAMRAKQLHENEYIQVTGYFDIVDASGDYFTIGAGENNYDYYLDDIQLYFKNDNQRQQVMNLSKGDKITVRCYMTTVGEIVGYMGDLIEIV